MRERNPPATKNCPPHLLQFEVVAGFNLIVGHKDQCNEKVSARKVPLLDRKLIGGR